MAVVRFAGFLQSKVARSSLYGAGRMGSRGGGSRRMTCAHQVQRDLRNISPMAGSTPEMQISGNLKLRDKYCTLPRANENQ